MAFFCIRGIKQPASTRSEHVKLKYICLVWNKEDLLPNWEQETSESFS